MNETNAIVYLDNSATTPLCDEAKAAITAALGCYGNPSSIHEAGLQARRLVESARAQLARALGLRAPLVPGSLVFTSCGSEANSLALLGCARAKARRTANKIVTTDSEHSAVEKVMQQLESEGWQICRLSTRGGALDPEELDRVLDDKEIGRAHV